MMEILQNRLLFLPGNDMIIEVCNLPVGEQRCDQ